MSTIPDFNDVVETLVENGAKYVAANKQSLGDEPVQLYYHLPVGVSDSQKETIETYLSDEVGYLPHDQQIGGIRIGDQPTPVCFRHVLHDGLHLYRREPVYIAEGTPGLDPVMMNEGIATVRKIVANPTESVPRPAETVPLKEMVESLADSGADSVEMQHQFLVNGEPLIYLRIPMVPADGKPILGPVDSVTVAGGTYPLRTTLTLDGTCGSNDSSTALYVSDNVNGLAPLSVERGMSIGRDLIAQAIEAESTRELESPQTL